MRRTLLVLLIPVLLQLGVHAQTPPKPAPQSTEMEKLMKEAQKELDKLSPQERAMFDQMMKSQLPQNNGGTSGNHFVPAKQTKQLSALKKLDTREQFDKYLDDLLAEARSNIPSATTRQVDDLIAKYKGNALALHNLPMLLFMQDQVPAAVYAGLVTAKGTEQPGTLNNLGSLLNQAGYPQYAIPILDYLIKRHNNAILLNNSGQAYLRLGDTATAYQRFMRAIKLDDHLAEAHSGIAHILLEQKRETEAAVHIAKTFRDGYSEALADHVTQKNVKLPFDDLKRKNKPDYFSPQKYMPLPPARTLNAALDNWNKITGMESEAAKWRQKSQELSRNLPATDEKWQLKLVTNSVNGPYKRKARLMAFLLMNTFNEYMASSYTTIADAEKKVSQSGTRMNETIELEYKNSTFKDRYEECLMIQKHIETYLSSTAEVQISQTTRLNSKYFDLVNEELYWLNFLLNSNEYRAEYANLGQSVVEWQRSLSNIQQLYPHVVNRGTLCQDILNNPPNDEELELVPGKCPITLKIPMVIASVKFNCEGWEIEGGEGIVINIERTYKRGKKAGQMTFAIGPGVGLDEGPVSVGAKAQIAFVFDDDFHPTDIVLRGEAKTEYNDIVSQTENGVKGMVSISGTASVDRLSGKVNDGNEVNIFKTEPK